MSKEQEVVDFEAFCNETELEEDMLSELYQVLLEEMLVEEERMLSCFSEKNYDKLRKIIHNIKGIAASYKVLDVFDIARNIDSDLKDEIYEGLEQKVVCLKEAIESSALYIRQHFGME